MPVKFRLLAGITAAAATLGGARIVTADILSETQSVSNSAISPFFLPPEGGQYTFAQWSPSVSFAQFDPSLGSLVSVTIAVQTGMTNILMLTGDNPAHTPEAFGQCTYSLEWLATITPPGSTAVAADHRPATGTIGDMLGRGVTSLYAVPPTGNSDLSMYTVDPADFSIYSGTGTIPFALTFDADFRCNDLFQCSVRDRVLSRATLTVEYEYTPVPSPGAAVPWILAGLSAAHRRRRVQSTKHPSHVASRPPPSGRFSVGLGLARSDWTGSR